MQGIESVVVGKRDVGIVVDEKRQHVVPLLGNGVVQRCISFRVLAHTHTHRQSPNNVDIYIEDSSSKRYKSVHYSLPSSSAP